MFIRQIPKGGKMPASKICRDLFWMIFEALSLDFIMQPWVPTHGTLLEKGIPFLIQKNEGTLWGLLPWSSRKETWNWITVSTSRGPKDTIVPGSICDCMEPGDRLVIEIQMSFWIHNRSRIRLAEEKIPEKQPA